VLHSAGGTEPGAGLRTDSELTTVDSVSATVLRRCDPHTSVNRDVKWVSSGSLDSWSTLTLSVIALDVRATPAKPIHGNELARMV